MKRATAEQTTKRSAHAKQATPTKTLQASTKQRKQRNKRNSNTQQTMQNKLKA